MEALLDFFDPTESQHSPPRRCEKDSLPSSLPPEVNARVCVYQIRLESWRTGSSSNPETMIVYQSKN